MILKCSTFIPLNGLWDTYEASSIIVYNFMFPPYCLLRRTHIPTWVDAQPLVALLTDIVFSWMKTLSPKRQNNRVSYLDPLLKLGIVMSLMSLPKLVGFATFSMSYNALWRKLPWFIVITSVIHCGLHVLKPSVTSTYKTHRDWYSFFLGKSCTWSNTGSSCSLFCS